MSYRDDTETVRAENERLRAENAALRSARWQSWALVAVCLVVNIAALIVARRGGIVAEGIVMVVAVALWAHLFFWLRRE